MGLPGRSDSCKESSKTGIRCSNGRVCRILAAGVPHPGPSREGVGPPFTGAQGGNGKVPGMAQPSETHSVRAVFLSRPVKGWKPLGRRGMSVCR